MTATAANTTGHSVCDVLDTVTHGTVKASSVVIVDANKHQDVCKLPVSGLAIGAAGSEVAVSATAAELNTTAGVTAGTVAASKHVVVDANKAVDAWTVTTTRKYTAGASTAAAGSATGDAGVLPAGTAPVYPTTAADDTKGVRLNAADNITGKLVMIGNGVSNKILKVYPPTGGTINGASADAAFSSASGKGVMLFCLDQTANAGAGSFLGW